MDYDPNKETPAERLARKKRERQAQKDAQQFTRENQPVDEEERKLANYTDAHMQEVLDDLGDIVAALNDDQYERWLKKNKRAVKSVGGKRELKKARTKAQKNSGCAVVGITLIGALSAVLGTAGWAVIEILSATL